MVICYVLGCKSRSERKLENITFHSFPKNSEICDKWIHATGRLNWKPNKYARICSLHFEEKWFRKSTKNTYLNASAVPKVYNVEQTCEKPKTRSRKNMFQSEHFLSKFGLEYIKHDVLFDDYKFKRKKSSTARKKEALFKLAQIFGFQTNEKYVTKKCSKFRHTFLLMLRHLVRRCLNQRWALDFALLLAPPWVRAVEMKIKLMSQAIEMECKEPMSPERLQAAGFKALLVEGAYAAVAAGNSLYGPEVVVDAISQNVSCNEPLVLWRGLCSGVKSLITLEAKCREGSHEADWRIADLILLYDDTLSIVTPACLSQPMQLQKLTYLYETVVKKDVENVLRNKGPNLLLAWMEVFGVYPFSNGFASLVFIQRQWHELKHLARCQVLDYRRNQSIQPHHLLQSIVDKYRHIVEEPFPRWTDLVQSKLVVELKSIDIKIYKKVVKDSVDELKEAMESAESVRKSSRKKRGPRVTYVTEDEMDHRVSGGTSSNNNVTYSDTMSVDSEKDTEDVSTSGKDDGDSEVSDTGGTKTDAEGQLIAKTIEKENLNNNNMKVVTNTEMDLRHVDPTKAKKCLIFDSDTDESSLCQTSYAIGVDRLTSGRHSNDIKVLNWMTESEGRNEFLKKLGTEGNTNLKMSTEDPKLAKTATIPLFRCDHTAAWRKYNTNNSIDTTRVPSTRLCPASAASQLRKHSVYSTYNSVRFSSRFNKNLDGLSDNFLRNVRNKRLLGLCRPLSVWLERMKSSNGERLGVRRAKRIQLPDIEEVRKINSTILTAEVAPVSMGRRASACEEKKEEGPNARHGEEAPTQEISNMDTDKHNIETESSTLMSVDEPTESAEERNASCIEPERGPGQRSKEIIQDQEPMSNDVEQKCDEKDVNTDEVPSVATNSTVAASAADDDDGEVLSDDVFIEYSTIQENNSKPVASSDSEDDLKLSMVVDKINKKWRKISRKRKIERKNNIAPSQSTAKRRKKKKPERKLSEHSDQCSDDYDEWSRQKNKVRKYFQLPNVSARPSAQANSPNCSPPALRPCGAAGQDVVLVTDSNQCTISINSTQPFIVYKNVNPHSVSVSVGGNGDSPAVIDLTDAPDDLLKEKEGTLNNKNNFSPIITRVYSMAEPRTREQSTNTGSVGPREQRSTRVAGPILISKMNSEFKKDQLVTIAPKLSVPGTAVPNLVPQVNMTVVRTSPGQQPALPLSRTDGDVTLTTQPTLYVSPSATPAQCASETAIPPLVSISADTANPGRRFVIIPKSHLGKGQKPLVMPNMRIVNVPLTYNPADHIQKVVVPIEAQASAGLAPLKKAIPALPRRQPTIKKFTLLGHWVQGRLENELIILQVDICKPAWTIGGGNIIVTTADYTCERPIYCSLGRDKLRTRILFPFEKNFSDVYKPTTVQIYENAANGNSPFADWVKSVLKNDKTTNLIQECNTSDTDIDGTGRAEPTKGPPGLGNEVGMRKDDGGNENAKPIARIKVKSFARLTEDQENDFEAPSRVSLRGAVYMKVSDRPLKYAKVITVIPSIEEFNHLMSMEVPLWVLPEGATSLDTLQPLRTCAPVYPNQANHTL